MEHCQDYQEGDLAVGFVVKDGGLLTFERLAPGYRELPGGKIEEDETPEDAVVREINEELGVTAVAIGELACMYRNWRWPNIRAHVVAAEIVLGVPYQREAETHGRVRYQTGHELRRAELSPVLARVNKMLVDGELDLHTRLLGEMA